MNKLAILEVRNLHKSFGGNHVLRGIDFDLEEGRVLSVIGSSGSGKTTLLRCITSLETADSGKITVKGNVVFDGDDEHKLTKEQIRKNRLAVGLVFQSFNLFPQYSVMDNITLAPRLQAKKRPDWRQNKKQILEEINSEALSLLAKVGLSDKTEAYPCELSGGQQQRVAAARALINKPDILFADEPTGNLDKTSANELIELLLSTRAELNQTLVMVTHDLKLAERADRILEMADGQLTDLSVSVPPIK